MLCGFDALPGWLQWQIVVMLHRRIAAVFGGKKGGGARR